MIDAIMKYLGKIYRHRSAQTITIKARDVSVIIKYIVRPPMSIFADGTILYV